MPIIRALFATILAILAQLLLATPANAKWLRAETKHFVIFSSGSNKGLQDFGVNLERFDTLMRLKSLSNQIPIPIS